MPLKMAVCPKGQNCSTRNRKPAFRRALVERRGAAPVRMVEQTNGGPPLFMRKNIAKTKKENDALRALQILALLKHQIVPAELQLSVVNKLLPGYRRVPQEAWRALRLYRAYLDYLEQLILLPEHAVPPDLID